MTNRCERQGCMDKMTVAFYGSVLDQTGDTSSFTPQNSPTIQALIEELGSHFGQVFKDFLLAEGTCFFLVNGRGIMTTGGLHTQLLPGDRIEILPFIEAG